MARTGRQSACTEGATLNASMAEPVAVTGPALPELGPAELPDGDELEELELIEVLLERHGRDALAPSRIRVQESELRGLTLREGVATELVLRDARLRGCDLSNLRVRSAEIRRVEVDESRLVGFAIEAGKIEDLRVCGGTMMLASLAHSALRRVVFENVNLREASFLGARLTSVCFDGCELSGADFRGARLDRCTIRGSSLDAVIGVDSLRGLTMPWPDLVGSVEALAAALGIAVESD
jgi:uncharacterized protein YjbI with pentapeptide repeats